MEIIISSIDMTPLWTAEIFEKNRIFIYVISREMISPSQYRITFDANGGILDGVDYIYISDSLNKTVTA